MSELNTVTKTSVKEDIRFFAQRLLAFVIDASLFWIFILSFEDIFQTLALNVFFSALFIGCFWETAFNTSPGKWVFGLSIKSELPDQGRALTLILRFLLFIGNMAIVHGLASLFTETRVSYLLCFGGLYLFLQPLIWMGTPRLNHDIIAQVVSIPFKNSIWIHGMLASVVTLFTLMLTLSQTMGYMHRGESCKLCSVKANMHTLQSRAEIYLERHPGNYPASLAILQKSATQAELPYWKDYSNPFTHKSGYGISNLDTWHRPVQGAVIYVPVPDSKTGKIKGYRIYGYDKVGKIIQDKGSDYVLQNEP